MSRRRLSPEERELWSRVARASVPLRPGATEAPPPAAARTAPPAPPAAPRPAPPTPFRVGEKADHRRDHDLLPGLAETLGRLPVRMDAGAFGRLRQGRLRPEARLDLHGMTAAEAHPALIDFVLSSRARGRRLLLVITGKGRARDELFPMPARARLRHDVPRWLALPPLAPAVLQVAPAHRRHGGEGALYVYLKAPGR